MDDVDDQPSEMTWTVIRASEPAPVAAPSRQPSLNVKGPVHLVRAHYAKQNFIALPKSLWPRTVADVTNAPNRWGGHGFIFVWVERERTDEGGAVVRERTLDSVYVQQSASTAAAINASLPTSSAVAPEVRDFIRALATRLAKDWAKETLRSSGDEGEVGP